MGLNVAPQFRVLANSKDITSTIHDRLKHLRLTDEAGDTADTLEICLSDHDPKNPIEIPPTGAELEVFLGYDGDCRRMGLFVVDEIELLGFPSQMTIRGRAAPYDTSKHGRLELQSQRTRSWEAGTTLGDLVRRIAGEHRLTPSISQSLGSIALPHTDQTHESDLNLLNRLAKRYDAIAKAAGGHLLLVQRGGVHSASGAALPRIVLTPSDGSDYTVTIAKRESPGTAIARYRDIPEGETKSIAVGEGEPVRQLRIVYPNRTSAEAAASAELRRRVRAERRLSYTVLGRSEVTAESVVALRGFRKGVEGEWLVTRAEHFIGPNGYRSMIEAERLNGARSESIEG